MGVLDAPAVARGGLVRTPYEHGAKGDGTSNDTSAVQAAYDWLTAKGGGTLLLPRGRFNITGNLTALTPGVSILGRGGIITGGEVLVGPATYVAGSGGVDFSGTKIEGVTFDRGDDYGTASRELVLRNVRGLDVSGNYFKSAGKGIVVDTADGNTKFHTVSMIRITSNRFAKLAFGVFANTVEWDRLSDWQITDNFFNYCSDTSVWIACTNGTDIGGVDGLNFAGNTIFSMNYGSSTDPLFASKRYNLRLGQTNWLRIINNNFFESGLAAVYLDFPSNIEFVGNNIAWPGQRVFSDALEIHGGSPKGVIEGNSFSLWTRSAIGFYGMSQLLHVEVGQNSWLWSADPVSWKGTGSVSTSNCFRVFVDTTGTLVDWPHIRDFQLTGLYDSMRGNSRIQSRDVKSPKGGVCGTKRSGLSIGTTSTVAIWSISDIYSSATSFGGLLSITVTSTSDSSIHATYLLFIAQGGVCTLLASGGRTTGVAATDPSFTWSLNATALQATSVGATTGSFNFDAVSLGAVVPN